jgi:hypothetical protein
MSSQANGSGSSGSSGSFGSFGSSGSFGSFGSFGSSAGSIWTDADSAFEGLNIRSTDTRGINTPCLEVIKRVMVYTEALMRESRMAGGRASRRGAASGRRRAKQAKAPAWRRDGSAEVMHEGAKRALYVRGCMRAIKRMATRRDGTRYARYVKV